jgi:hypothetical protein
MKIFLGMVSFVIIWTIGGITFINLFPTASPPWIMVFGFLLGVFADIISNIISRAVIKRSQNED